MVQVGKQRDFVTSAVGQCVGLHHGDRLYAGVSVKYVTMSRLVISRNNY